MAGMAERYARALKHGHVAATRGPMPALLRYILSDRFVIGVANAAHNNRVTGAAEILGYRTFVINSQMRQSARTVRSRNRQECRLTVEYLADRGCERYEPTGGAESFSAMLMRMWH